MSFAPFELSDILTYRRPRRIVLSGAVAAILLLADFDNMSIRVLLGAIVVVWVICELIDLLFQKGGHR